jgi:hypothetical protein
MPIMHSDSGSLLEKYRGFEVEILYLVQSGAYKDRGVLSDFGDNWIELQKGGVFGELFLIPINAIRLMKVVTPASESPSSVLLRPAQDGPSTQEEIQEDPQRLKSKLRK